ncbi:hypothetical protein SAMN05421858_4088 [Haladaptatus litoreus]|uniref:Uncharacterized protein n=1 Tax=Haladaptatus litoreus TaxID=553468 RepID=A0A1N7E7H5_9EURY|nr:hypothetical protein [Haladaptatus litoreus]SIR84021.1 hypothetical protein SAMN05421858_4088 [Haladaptatus litoreus]
MVFVTISSTLTILLWNTRDAAWPGALTGGGVTLYLFAAAKINEWASRGDGRPTARPELWFGVWFVVSATFALLELPSSSGTVVGIALYGLFVGAGVTIGLFLVALLNRVFFSR